MAAVEVKRGDFVYHDIFFVDLGGGKRYPRASIADLRDLLLPKTIQDPTKDKVAHWYEAQLVHYGLARTKDKNTAKVRLTAAISTGTLAVPTRIGRLEADMRREFTASKRRTRASDRSAGREQPQNVSQLAGMKRKARTNDNMQATASSTKVSVRVGDVTLDIGHHQSRTKSSKRHKSAMLPTGPKQTASDLSQSISSPATSEHRLVGIDDQYRYDSNTDDEQPPAYESLDFNREPDWLANQPDVTTLQVSGTYVISPPFGHGQCELTLVKDELTDQFWGHFIAADQRGVLNIPDADGLTTQNPINFRWRAEDLNLGHLRFRRDQTGWIQFDGHGGVRGCWEDLSSDGDIRFAGELNGPPDIEAKQLIDYWAWFISSAYGR